MTLDGALRLTVASDAIYFFEGIETVLTVPAACEPVSELIR